jgi:hypothetical protein
MNWIDVAQDRDRLRALMSTLMNLWVPLNIGRFFSSCATGCFLGRPQLHGVTKHNENRSSNWITHSIIEIYCFKNIRDALDTIMYQK